MRFFLAITTLVWRVAAHPLDHGTDILILEWTFLLRIGLLRPDIDVRRPHGIAWGVLAQMYSMNWLNVHRISPVPSLVSPIVAGYPGAIL